MTEFPRIDFTKTTRLVRQGRLREAMEALRGTNGGASPTGKAPGGLAEKLAPFAKWAAGAATAYTHRDAGTGQAKAEAAGGRFETHAFSGEGGSRNYKLYVPTSYSGAPLPLVVMLHGCTQSPDDFAAGTRMNEIAEREGVLVAYPEQTRAANMQKCWNWFNTADQARGAGEPALIAGIVDQIGRDVSVEHSRVYVAGLSAGGAAAAIMGRAYPEIFAAVGVHSGLACGAARDVPSAFAAMREGSGQTLRTTGPAVPTIVFHGTRDATVNPVNAGEVIAQAKAASRLDETASTGTSPGGVSYRRVVETGADGKPMIESWTLDGVGHAWSGGSAAGTYTDPAGPDASTEMLRFFLSHRLAT